MATLHIEHAISDFGTWSTAYAAAAPFRDTAGVRAARVSQPEDDPRYVVVQLDFDTSGDQRSAQRNGQARRKVHALRCMAHQNQKWFFLLDYSFQDLDVRILAVCRQLVVLDDNHSLNFLALELIGERAGFGAQYDSCDRLAEFTADALRANEKFRCDRF